jgi:hypothetical protein
LEPVKETGQTANATIKSVNEIRSAVSTLINLIFPDIKVTDHIHIQKVSLNFIRNNKYRTSKYIESWKGGKLLTLIRSITLINEDAFFLRMCFKQTQEITAALLAFFTLLRPIEIVQLSLEGWRDQGHGYILSTVLKNAQFVYTDIFIPHIEEEAISPARWVSRLIRLNKLIPTYKGKDDFLFIDWVTGKQASSYYIRQLLKSVLNQLEASSQYTAYSFKHAAISYLVERGVPEKDIEEAARYRSQQKSSMVANYYAVSEALKRIHLLLAKASELNPVSSSSVSQDHDIIPFQSLSSAPPSPPILDDRMQEIDSVRGDDRADDHSSPEHFN